MYTCTGATCNKYSTCGRYIVISFSFRWVHDGDTHEKITADKNIMAIMGKENTATHTHKKKGITTNRVSVVFSPINEHVLIWFVVKREKKTWKQVQA